jgi:hypothetical protein
MATCGWITLCAIAAVAFLSRQSGPAWAPSCGLMYEHVLLSHDITIRKTRIVEDD